MQLALLKGAKQVLASQKGLAQLLPYWCFQIVTSVVKFMVLFTPYNFTGKKGATNGVALQQQLS